MHSHAFDPRTLHDFLVWSVDGQTQVLTCSLPVEFCNQLWSTNYIFKKEKKERKLYEARNGVRGSPVTVDISKFNTSPSKWAFERKVIQRKAIVQKKMAQIPVASLLLQEWKTVFPHENRIAFPLFLWKKTFFVAQRTNIDKNGRSWFRISPPSCSWRENFNEADK